MNSNKEKIAVVTGANRGIGFEICRQSAQKGIRVILTSRKEEKGVAACHELKEEGLSARYQQLDVSDALSINRFRKWVEDEEGRCDILVNNTGIFPDSASANADGWPSVFETSIETVRAAIEILSG